MSKIANFSSLSRCTDKMVYDFSTHSKGPPYVVNASIQNTYTKTCGSRKFFEVTTTHVTQISRQWPDFFFLTQPEYGRAHNASLDGIDFDLQFLQGKLLWLHQRCWNNFAALAFCTTYHDTTSFSFNFAPLRQKKPEPQPVTT